MKNAIIPILMLASLAQKGSTHGKYWEPPTDQPREFIIRSFFGKGLGEIFTQRIELFKGPDDQVQDPSHAKQIWWARAAGEASNTTRIKVVFATAVKEREFEKLPGLNDIEIVGFESIQATGYPPYGMELPPARGWACHPLLVIYDKAK
ncbi:MAG: hypothetical protein JWO82_1304 [Akkermansiaceae bacterium]|nr:hypothetical protein [Akkermansiaceae bacterium]